MNFDKEFKSEEKKSEAEGGGGGGGREKRGFQRKKKKPIFFVLMLYIKFQVPDSRGSLVLTQTKGVTDRYGA